MKIGYISRNYPPNIEGGAEISLSLLANALAKKGHKVFIFVPEDKINKDTTEGVNPKIYRFKWSKKTPFSLENPLAVNQFVNKIIATYEKPDLIDGWNYITPLNKLSQKLQIPYIVSLRDSTPLCDLRFDTNPRSLNMFEYFKYRFKNRGISIKEIFYGIFGFYLTNKRQEIIKCANMVTYVSIALQKAFSGTNKNSAVIYSIAKPQNNIKKNEKIFLYAGRKSFGKGTNFLHDIAQEISRKRKDIKFLFVSNTDHQEVLNLMQKSYAVIVPSIVFEAFPRSAIESIALGTPVIGTNVGGIPEAVGEAGIITNPDKKSLEDAIIKLSDNKTLYDSLRIKTRIQAKKFEENTVSEKVLNIYKEVLK